MSDAPAPRPGPPQAVRLAAGLAALGPGAAVVAARWGVELTTEVLRLPGTLRDLRASVDGLAALPEHVRELARLLAATSETLERHLPALSAAVSDDIRAHVEQLSVTVSTLEGRLGHLSAMLEEAVPPLQGLPEQLGGFGGTVHALDEQVTVLTASLAELLPRLTSAVDEDLPERLEHLDAVVSELGATVTAAVGSIPGVRRSLPRE